MIKEMANFVEPFLPSGFRTRLQDRGSSAGPIPSPAAPAAPSQDDSKPAETKPPQ